MTLKNNLRSDLFTVAVALGLGLSALTAKLDAQQVVCFSFDGIKNISGKDNLGGASKTGVRVGGKTVMIGAEAGDSPATCAGKLHTALTKAGFKAKKASSTVVCVEAGPGGASTSSRKRRSCCRVRPTRTAMPAGASRSLRTRAWWAWSSTARGVGSGPTPPACPTPSR